MYIKSAIRHIQFEIAQTLESIYFTYPIKILKIVLIAVMYIMTIGQSYKKRLCFEKKKMWSD